ncbi:MAG: ATP-binding protein [Deltaproteobacteria bacterium]|nr:ATP-binding protein [Deltaproteobacteria bacterium]
MNHQKPAWVCGRWADLCDRPVFALDAQHRLLDGNTAFFRAHDVARDTLAGTPAAKLFGKELAAWFDGVAAEARRSSKSVRYALPADLPVDRAAFVGNGWSFAALALGGDGGAPEDAVLFMAEKEGSSPEISLSMLSSDPLLELPLLDYVNDIVYLTDTDGRVIYINNQLEPRTGYKHADIVGGFATTATHEEDRPLFSQLMRDARSGRAGLLANLRIRHKDGRILRFSISYGPLTAPDGRFLGVVGFARDITREVVLETRLQRARNLEMMRSLAEAIASEFDATLIGILSNSSLLRVMTERTHPARPYIERIEEAARRIENLTQQLIACTRSGRGQPQPLALNQILKQVVDRMRSSVDRNVLLSFEGEDTVGPVYADPIYVTQMIENLVNNSWDALPDGGAVEVRTAGELITTDEGEEREYVRITVRDNGIGIETADLEKVTEPFFTTKSTRRGLGLTAVESIVANLGGMLDIQSRPGEGTIVTIHLPVMRVMALPDQDDDQNAPRAETVHVLVVDDEEVIREFCAAAFRATGTQVTLVGEAERALEIYKRNLTPTTWCSWTSCCRACPARNSPRTCWRSVPSKKSSSPPATASPAKKRKRAASSQRARRC